MSAQSVEMIYQEKYGRMRSMENKLYLAHTVLERV